MIYLTGFLIPDAEPALKIHPVCMGIFFSDFQCPIEQRNAVLNAPVMVSP